MRATNVRLPQGPISIRSTDPANLDEIHEWIHDRAYDPDNVRYRSNERILEVPFFCTIYQDARDYRGFLLVGSWWIPVVRGYLRIHHVGDYSIRDDGPGMINEIRVSPARGKFRVTGISEITGAIDAFEVSVELRDKVIGWVRMRWVLIAETEGPLEGYDEQADDLAATPTTAD